MSWEALGDLDFHHKVLAIIASLVTIGVGIVTVVWRVKTWNRRRLKLLQEYLANRETNISDRRPHLLGKVANSLYNAPPPEEPNVNKEVEEAIRLLGLHHVSAAQTKLEGLQDRITEKLSFIQRYNEELTRHQANVYLFLAAIADRRNQPGLGLKHISKAKAGLGEDVEALIEVLKYEGLLHLKESNWKDARDAFKKLEEEATKKDKRHYKAVGAKGRGDALVGLKEMDDAIDAYSLALKRIGEAEPQHRDPVFTGVVSLKLAQLQAANGDDTSLLLAGSNALDALKSFKSTNGLGVLAEDMREAEKIKARADAARDRQLLS
jgi:tetratricopeptide (TPR) repeat protein